MQLLFHLHERTTTDKARLKCDIDYGLVILTSSVFKALCGFLVNKKKSYVYTYDCYVNHTKTHCLYR